MSCRFFNEISDEWVGEKLNCINPQEREIERRIERTVKEKKKSRSQYFRPEEFTLFLRWKGLAKNIQDFLDNNSSEKVANITHRLFSSKLCQWSFENTNTQLKNNILTEINLLFNNLQNMHRVGPAVASACLALCFPDLCVTADYIVPALLHNMYDANGNMNHFFQNNQIAQLLQQCQIMPVQNSLSAFRARNIATYNYTEYIQEFWNIKRIFKLTYQVRKIEASVWSFGICYIGKGRDNNNVPNDNLPLKFNSEPSPPRGGPFSKPRFNQNGFCIS